MSGSIGLEWTLYTQGTGINFRITILCFGNSGCGTSRSFMLIKFWPYWCKALGTKAYDDDKKADKVAIIRTIWVAMHVITCMAICANAIHTIFY